MLSLAAAAVCPARALAQSPPPIPPATRPARKPDAWTALRDESVAAFDSGNAARIAQALAKLREAGKHMGAHEQPIEFLMQLKRYDDAQQLAADLILSIPHNSGFVAIAEKLRTQAFIGEKKYPDALSSARSYYDLAHLNDSAGAIDLVALCLALGKPDDHTIATRFRKQQIAWATVDPASQPSSPSLGDPILATIPPDSKPFEGAADKVVLDGYEAFRARANLLLLEGNAKEARATFERAQGIAADSDQPGAIENVARAIRAQAGCIAPANAYILQMREQQQ